MQQTVDSSEKITKKRDLYDVMATPERPIGSGREKDGALAGEAEVKVILQFDASE